MRIRELLSLDPAVLIPAVVREHAEREGGLKRGLAAAAHAMVLSVCTVRHLLYAEAVPSPRVRVRAQWAGLTLAQERIDRACAEEAAFNRLVGEVERELVEMGLAGAQATRVGLARRQAGARRQVVRQACEPAARADGTRPADGVTA